MKRFLCIFLMLSTLAGALCSLSSCGSSSPAVLSYKGLSLSQNQFIYELAMEKTTYLSENDLSSDDASLWSQKTESGETVDTACMNGLIRSLTLRLYFASLAKEQGYDLTQKEKEMLKENMQSYVNNFVDRRSFDAYMRNFSVGYDEILACMELQYLSQKGQALLFGEGKEYEVTEEDALSFFNRNFVTVKHIYINNVFKTYPNQKQVPLTEEEKAQKNEFIAQLEKELSPETFASKLSVSEDGFSKPDAKAVTFAKGSMEEAYEKAAWEQNIGTVAKAECKNGVYFILREPLDASVLTEDYKKEIMSLLTEEAFNTLYAEALKDVKSDREILNLYSFSSAKYFTSFEPS